MKTLGDGHRGYRCQKYPKCRKELKMERKEVYELIDGERDYQAEMGARRVLPIEGEMLLLSTYLRKAETVYAETFGDPGEMPTMDVIRKIAAIAVRCMENHPTPPREK